MASTRLATFLRPLRVLLTALGLLLPAGSLAFAQSSGVTRDSAGNAIGFFPSGEIRWRAGPASLRPGTMMTVLEGNPAADGVFTMRLKLPGGFVVSPHWHSQIEHVTVVSGTLHFGMGERFDRTRTRTMPAGSFGYWPVGMRHYAWAEGETVLQLHGRGPWTVTYVDAADDPRVPKAQTP